MVETFDAASRLAEGRPAAEAVSDYVWACHLLGYQDPDLTLHASQVRDWYGSEDGIDLRALDADSEALRAAAASAEGVLARQEVQLLSMAVAWQGPGAHTSREFLRRHGEASAAVVNAVRQAAESLAVLRDQLWHSVDGKVAATIAAESRAVRADWQAAVQTVTTGAGDRAKASELVDQEVKPFVDNDIRSEWLTAIRSAIAAVSNAYDTAAAELAWKFPAEFDVPGEFGPTWSAPPIGDVATAPAGTPPVWSAAPAAQPLPGPSALPPPPSAPPVEPAAAMAPPSLPSVGGAGMPDIGSGLSGFGGQLGDMLGGLLGSSQDALSDLAEIDEPPEPDDEPDEDDQEDDEEGLDDTEDTEADPADDVVAESQPEEPPADPPPPAPTETPIEPPPPIEPLSAPEPAAAGTPCEIAANELPQVGE